LLQNLESKNLKKLIIILDTKCPKEISGINLNDLLDDEE
jgi:hypothetical protein